MVGGYGILAVVTLFFKYSGYEGCVGMAGYCEGCVGMAGCYEGCVGMAGCHTLLRMSLKYSN